jgi:hypothetical protein
MSQQVWHVKSSSLLNARIAEDRSKFPAQLVNISGNGYSHQIAKKIAQAAINKQSSKVILRWL